MRVHFIPGCFVVFCVVYIWFEYMRKYAIVFVLPKQYRFIALQHFVKRPIEHVRSGSYYRSKRVFSHAHRRSKYGKQVTISRLAKLVHNYRTGVKSVLRTGVSRQTLSKGAAVLTLAFYRLFVDRVASFLWIQFAHTAADHIEALFSLVATVRTGVAFRVRVSVQQVVNRQRSGTGGLTEFTRHIQHYFTYHTAAIFPEGVYISKLEGLHRCKLVALLAYLARKV